MKIGFIGAGKAGSAFGRYLQGKGLDISGYCSRSIQSSQCAADFTSSKVLSLEELVEVSDYIFITTPDSIISSIWDSLSKFNLKNKCIFHMSGCLNSDVFNNAHESGAYCYSIHPLYPFTDRNCYNVLHEVIFSVEGKNIDNIIPFLEKAELRYFVIDKHNKAKYHAAAVFASNYIVTLAEISKKLFLDCEMDEKLIVDAIFPLMQGAVFNIKEKGIENALTGPIVRGDDKTIKLHLDNLNMYKDIYKYLGLIAVDMEIEKMEDNKIICENSIYKREKLNIIRNLLGVI